jgi:hypothetical protein
MFTLTYQIDKQTSTKGLDSQTQAFITLKVNQSASLSELEIRLLRIRYSGKMRFEKYSHKRTHG